MKLKDKIMLITGAGGSIGSGVAAVCLKEGATLALADRDMAALERLAEHLQLDPARHMLLQTDVADEQQVRNMVDAVLLRYGRLDVFHNNAGTGGRRQSIADLEMDAYRAWMDVNLFGFVCCLKYVLQAMYRQGSGSIINTSSQAAKKPAVGGVDYCLQKSAVMMMTKIAALESNGKNVRVNCILPGYVDSAMMQKNFAVFPALEQSIEKNVPLNRMCSVEEIGRVVAFLGSDEASYITGAPIYIDGGWLSTQM